MNVVRSKEVAAQQEPGDHGAEAPATQPPLVQELEVASLPARGHEPEHGDEQEKRAEDRDCDAVYLEPLVHARRDLSVGWAGRPASVRWNLPVGRLAGRSGGRVFR
jgi:hypothetical protein